MTIIMQQISKKMYFFNKIFHKCAQTSEDIQFLIQNVVDKYQMH
jgi:hypothetical protein